MTDELARDGGEPQPDHDPRSASEIDADEAIASGEDPTSADYSVAFTPRNVAVGLAIVAGLVAVAVSRRRRSGGGGG